MIVSQFDTISTIGERLRASRVKAGFTPEEVAQKTGISRAAVYRYESGQPIKIDTLAKIAGLLQVSLTSLIGAGVEYIPSALRFFERMRQLETSAEQLSVLFGPISYLLTTDSFDEMLIDVLAESVPEDVSNRPGAIVETLQIIEVLKERKRLFKERRPNIVSLVSAGELEQFYNTGFIGCSNPKGVDIAKRRKGAALEINNIIHLLQEQPIGIQVGVLVDSLPGTSFQIFKQSNYSQVAISPFSFGTFANVRIGVAAITSDPEAIKLHAKMAETLWQRSLKGGEAADYLLKKIFN